MTYYSTQLLWNLLALWQTQINQLAAVEADHAMCGWNTAATRGEYWPYKASLIAASDAALYELARR